MMLKIKYHDAWCLFDNLQGVHFGNIGGSHVRFNKTKHIWEMLPCGEGHHYYPGDAIPKEEWEAVETNPEALDWREFEPSLCFSDRVDYFKIAAAGDQSKLKRNKMSPEEKAKWEEEYKKQVTPEQDAQNRKWAMEANKGSCEKYLETCWVRAFRKDEDEEALFVFDEGYILNDDGKTIEVVR